jgi:VWFA-related protein
VNSKSRITIWVLTAGLLAATVTGQEAQFYGEVFVSTVNVPVRVIDRDGNPVRGLTVDDFEILEDGQQQEISNFSEIVSSRPTSPGDDPETRRFFVGPADRRRELVYFFDLVLSEKEDKRRAVEGLRSLYAGGVPSGETVTIVAFDGAPRPIVERSGSYPEIMDGLAQVDESRAQGLMQRIHAEDPGYLAAGYDPLVRDQVRQSISRPLRRQYYHELQQRVEMVMYGLSATMARYAGGDARRALVVFTPGLPGASNWNAMDGSREAELDEQTDIRQRLWLATAMEASDLGFTLYFVDSSTARTKAELDVDKPVVVGSGLEWSGESESNVEEDADADSPFGHESTRRSLLGEAAYITGGESFHHSDVDRAVRRVAQELSHYYSLGYQPGHRGDGREHRIAVRLPEHPQYRVVHRRRYVDRSIEQREEQHLRAQILFQSGTNPHGATVELGEASKRFRAGARGMKRVVVPVSVHVPFAEFTMFKQGAEFGCMATFSFMVEDRAGNTSPVISHEMTVNVPRDQVYGVHEGGHFTFVTDLETEGGKQTLHVAVTDVLAGRTSVVSLGLKF